MRDKIKIYNTFECFDAKCSSCGKKTHFAFECPRIHYMPNRDFLIRRLTFSAPQKRLINPNPSRHRKFSARRNLALVQVKADRHKHRNNESMESSDCEESLLQSSEQKIHLERKESQVFKYCHFGVDILLFYYLNQVNLLFCYLNQVN